MSRFEELSGSLNKNGFSALAAVGKAPSLKSGTRYNLNNYDIEVNSVNHYLTNIWRYIDTGQTPPSYASMINK